MNTLSLRHLLALSNCFISIKYKYKNLVPIFVPIWLTKMIYLDTRTRMRMRVSVMLVLGLIHHHAHPYPNLSP
jgi:hypothetical protein